MNKKHIVPILIIIGVFTYYLFRPLEMLVFLFSLYLIFVVGKLRKSSKIIFSSSTKKYLIILAIAGFLIFSFFNTRLYSYDGLNTHIRLANLIKDNGFVSIIYDPIKPYFGELLLGNIWKYLGLRAVNLTFGVLTVISSILAYSLIKKICKEDKHLTNLSFLLFIFSSPFIAMALYEFKVDLFLLVISQLLFLLLTRVSKQNASWVFLIVSALCGISFIIKTSFIPTAVIVMIVAFIYLIKSVPIILSLIVGALGAVFLLAPITLWSVNYGFTIPLFENTLKINSSNVQNGAPIVLTRNAEILDECYNEKIQKDYSSFIYGARTPLVLIQPFYYFTRMYSYPFSSQPMANPGPFLYLGVFLLLASPLLSQLMFFSRENINLYIVSTSTLIIFYIFVASLYWYLLFLFPFFSIMIVKYIQSIENNRLKKILSFALYASIITNVVIAIATTLIYFNPIPDYSAKYLQNSNLKALYTYNKNLAELSSNGYILNASEHKDQMLMPFMKDNDTRVIKSNYYFVSSQKSLEEINIELKSNNIKYITVHSNALTSTWYKNCPKENNRIIKGYLEKYAFPIFVNGISSEPLIFEIR